MKTFLACVISFFIIIGIVIGNSLCIGRLMDEMLDITDKMDKNGMENSLSDAVKLRDLAEEKDFFLALTINHSETELMKLRITEIISRIEASDEENYAFALDSLKEILTELKKSESFSLEGII